VAGLVWYRGALWALVGVVAGPIVGLERLALLLVMGLANLQIYTILYENLF